MELKDFVSSVLCQIIDGVQLAQEHAKTTTALVSPSHVVGATGSPYFSSDTSHAAVQPISFDVAVTVTDGKETNGGIGVVVGPVALGSRGASKESSSSISRIQFVVPIILPGSIAYRKRSPAMAGSV